MTTCSRIGSREAWTLQGRNASLCFLALGVSFTIEHGRDARAQIPKPPQPEVVAEKVIPDTLDIKRWKVTGPVHFSVSEKDAPNTKNKALRVEVSLTPQARKKRSFTGEIFTFAAPQNWSDYNRLVLWVYVEPSKTPRGGSLSVHLYDKDKIRRTMGVYVVPRGRWQEVTWDLTPMPRAAIGKFMVTQGVSRHNPGEGDRNVFHLGRMELRRVEPATKVRGWELEPHRVAFSHVGYLPAGEKTAIFSGSVRESARLLDAQSGRVVWQGKLETASHPKTGKFKVADFSEWRRPGRYVLVADSATGPVVTEPFSIKPDVYQETVRRVLDFYRAERCGDAAPGYHAACHLDDGRVEPYAGMKPERFAPEVRALFGKHVDCSGGWHDAGDMAKFAYQEYNSAYQMFRLYERGLRYARPGTRRDAVLDEALWGAEYAVKTLLPTGRHCDRPERVGMGVWTDCKPGNEDDRQVGMTTWQCAERYVAGMMAEAIAARLMRMADPALADRCLEQARLEAEAYLTGAMKDWRSSGWLPLRYAAVGMAFLELYRATDDERYAKEAARCGDELAACQERSLAWNKLGLTGFWYEGPKRQHPFAHSAGDGRCAYLLAELCREFPSHSAWMEWYAALRIYTTFYALRSAEYLTPYGVPAFSLHDGPKQPYQYWDHARVTGQRKSQKLDFQFDRLVRVGHRYLVRVRNTTGSLSMNAATLAAVADVARDPAAEAMAQRCFQWMLGRNPFSRSQVWGVGYRYREQPHYVATHAEMPGSIPCKGIDGRLDGDGQYHDEPFSDPLPRCVINEVCIAQGGYFLNAARELALPPRLSGVIRGGTRPAEVVARFAGMDEVAARARVDDKGEYALTLPGGGWYDIECGPVCRREFVATATSRRGFDIDLAREISVAVECPARVQPGVRFSVRVQVQGLSETAAASRHELRLRLHNVECPDAQRTVAVPGRHKVTATFSAVAKRPSEPFLILAVPDGQLAKRGEAMGVVGRRASGRRR